MAEVDNIQTSILAGASLSAQTDIGTKSVVGIVLPSNWTAAAAGITFQVSIDGGLTWNELLTVSGAAYTVAYTAAGGAYIGLDPATLRGFPSLKVRSGTVGAPVNQTNAVTLQLVTRLVF
jgi:hypothetical protein